MKPVLAIALLALLGSACSADERLSYASAATQTDRSALLDQAGAQWLEAYQKQDWQQLRSLYTDDAVLMTHGQPKIEGADNIIEFLQRIPDAGGTVRFRFTNEEAIADGDYGTVTAKYYMAIAFPGQDTMEVAGRSLLIYKWRNGQWLLWRDIDNQAPDATVADFAR